MKKLFSLLALLFFIVGFSNAQNDQVRKNQIKLNFSKFYKVDLRYDADKFIGGISNVSIRLENNTEYFLDKIIIFVEYYTRDGYLYQRRKVEIDDMLAYTERTVNVEGANKGIEARWRYAYVRSSPIGLEWITQER